MEAKIPTSDCRGQQTDNATMSGFNQQVQAHIHRLNGAAIFSSCIANSLNLTGVDAAELLPL